MQNKLVLFVGVVLVLFGIFKPDLSNLSLPVGGSTVCVTSNHVADAPANEALLNKARAITEVLLASDDSTRKSDCIKLSSLYCDIATLIELDKTDLVITDTSTIREVNSVAGKMLRLDIKDKYPNLAELAKDLVVTNIGDDDVILDEELRLKAVEAFRALSWAFWEGSK
jgi:hypothetical protein